MNQTLTTCDGKFLHALQMGGSCCPILAGGAAKGGRGHALRGCAWHIYGVSRTRLMICFSKGSQHGHGWSGLQIQHIRPHCWPSPCIHACVLLEGYWANTALWLRSVLAHACVALAPPQPYVAQQAAVPELHGRLADICTMRCLHAAPASKHAALEACSTGRGQPGRPAPHPASGTFQPSTKPQCPRP